MRKFILPILDHLLETLDDAIFLKDGGGKWLYVNNYGKSLFGLENIDWQGKTDIELSELNPLYKDAFLKCLEDDNLVWNLGSVLHFEENVIGYDGYEYIFDVQKVPLFFADGKREALYIIGREISKQRHAENTLLAKEKFYNSLFDNAPFPYQSLDMNAYLLDVNKAWCEWLGYEKNEVVGHSMTEFLSSESLKTLADAFPRFIETGAVNHLGITLIHKSGKLIDSLVSGKIDLDLPHESRHTHCVFIDESIKDEQNRILQKDQAYLKFLIDSIGVSVYGINQDGLCTFINPIGVKTLGFDNANEIIGKSMHELIHHSNSEGIYLPKLECELHRAYIQGEYFHSENETFWRKNHTPFNIEYWSQPMVENGVVTGAVTTFVDITERLIARSQLINNEKRFREMFEQAPLPYQSLDENGFILDINHAWLSHFGYERQEVVGHSYQEFITTESLDTLYKNFPNLVARGFVNNVEFDIVCKDGSIRHIELEGRRSIDSHGKFLHTHCILSDVTEKTKYINDLKLSARIIQSAAEGIMITDSERNILSVNPAFSTLTGYSFDEVVGKKPSILKSGKHSNEFYETMTAVLEKGETWQGEIWNRKKNGDTYVELISINPVFDDAHNIIHYLAIFADITQQKMTEEKLHFLAHHDSLTSLPNRLVLFENLTNAIAMAERDAKSVALLMLDLDRFKHGRFILEHLLL